MQSEYRAVDAQVLETLNRLVGKENVLTRRERLIDYSHDEFSLTSIHRFPDVVVKPSSTAQTAEVMRFAHEARIPVTPRGGGTGLCGGCVPVFGGIVLSLENMGNVREIDTNNLMAVAEAGVPLSAFYEQVEASGLFFPPHPGDENATIGGVIATNAGGARAVKYGVIRNFVRGVEVVLPDGEVVEIGGKIIKSSTGYSLLHLMIGSEGTLGIVTRATLSLLPPPAFMYTLIAPFENLHDAIRTVPGIIRNRILPMAVEFVDLEVIRITEAYLNKRWPTHQGSACLMIVVDGASEEEVLALSENVRRVCMENRGSELFVADTRKKQQNVLDIRSRIYEAMRDSMVELLDITLPRARIADFVEAANRVATEMGLWLPSYGHAADGNVHTHIMRATWKDGVWTEIHGWEEKYSQARDRLHELGKALGGTISGEHGIGLVKKAYLEGFLGTRQIQLMKAVKQAFDPHGILNPGKIL